MLQTEPRICTSNNTKICKAYNINHQHFSYDHKRCSQNDYDVHEEPAGTPNL